MSNGTNTNSSGENSAALDYVPGVPGHDFISDAAMAEIVRRTLVRLGSGVSGAVVAGSTPPQDKSKLWDKGDGNIYRYDTQSGEWLPTTAVPDVEEFPGVSGDDGNTIELRTSGIYAQNQAPRVFSRTAEVVSDVGDDPGIVYNFGAENDNFDNTEFAVIVLPLFDWKEGTRFYETGRTNGSVTIKFVTAADIDISLGSLARITVIENINA